MKRFEVHSHSMYSNIRLLDAINRPKELIEMAAQKGLSGICLTDHEALCGHIDFIKGEQELRKAGKLPEDFKIGLGNEIYLVPSLDKSQITKYFHFILIAKNKLGHQALKELSSLAWFNSFTDRGMERVPTSYANLKYIVEKYPNSLIATTACIGGELPYYTLTLAELEHKKHPDEEAIYDVKLKINDFLIFMKDLFGDDFYIEIAPSLSPEQIAFNDRIIPIAEKFNIKMVIGTDAHYLTEQDRFIHKAYLTSKEGDREVDEFYSYTYLMDYDELLSHFLIGQPKIDELCANSIEIMNKIETYSLKQEQRIPTETVQHYDKTINPDLTQYEYISKYLVADNEQDRYWINTCLNKLHELDRFDDRNLSRLEKEADIQFFISERLGQPLSAYHNTMQHYIDLFWDCGSIIGPGRGSACGWLSNMLLGITQVDPLRWGLNEWRYLNKERAEIGDIDIDLAPSKRPLIFAKIRDQKAKGLITDNTPADIMRQNVGGLLQVCTFGTEGARLAIHTACRGYRSPEFPAGIDVDIAHYLSGMIPQERGFLWPIKDVVEGNEELDRKPIRNFIDEVSKYDGLLDIILKIEGLVNKRSQHASGVVLYNNDFFETNALMKSPNGDYITQFDLHTSEYLGDIKFDFLLTDVSDKIITTINLLQEQQLIDPNLNIRTVYNRYLHPEIIDLTDQRIWDALAEGSVLDVFQFNSDVGLQAAKAIKPQNPFEMTAANALMRLMAEKGHERPLDRYVRLKNDLPSWYKEMTTWGLSQAEVEILEPYYKQDYGTPPYQESVMLILMDKNISNFTLAEANDARKIIGKKQMSRIPELKERFFSRCTNTTLANYVWETAIYPQLGYSFSINHSLPYSFVGIQTILLATNWPSLFWNCACLISNSGGAADIEDPEDINDDDDEEEDEEEVVVKKKKPKTTDYGKIATAIGIMSSAGINIYAPDINKSNLTFTPDLDLNIIRYGMRGITKVGDGIVTNIIANRPYTSMADFLSKVKVNKPQMVNLIKSGAFDSFNDDRMVIMREYIESISDQKQRLTMQNAQMLFSYDILPEDYELHKKIFFFNKYLKKNKDGRNYKLDNYAYLFYEKHFDIDLLTITVEDDLTTATILQTQWDKIYKAYMEEIRTYVKANHDNLLQRLNKTLVDETWDKYCSGTISKWEMDSVSFYSHEHELAPVNDRIYDFDDFFSLPEQPEIETFIVIHGNRVPIYKLHRIAGTVLNKNKNKSTVTVLTKTGVVTVKVWQNQFVKYDRQLSQRLSDGKKKVIEKSWFSRGNKIAIVGIRRDDMFVPKIYSKSEYDELFNLITDIDEHGYLQFQTERAEVE